MSYSEDLKAFAASHKYEDVMVDGAKFHYVLNGRKDSQTLVMLNGGMNTLEMWMNYVDAFSEDYQVLLFDYPQELRTNQELVTGMHAFFRKIGVKKPIFVGRGNGSGFHRRNGCRNLENFEKEVFLCPGHALVYEALQL